VPKTGGNKLPGGFKIAASKDSSNAVLSGKPSVVITQPTEFSFIIQVADKTKPQKVRTREYTLTIYPALSMVVPASSLVSEVGLPLTLNPVAKGGTGVYAWKIASGSLPDGLLLDAKTGSISGTITKDGTFKFSLNVSDQATGTVSVSISVTVYKVVTILPPKIKPGKANKPFSLSLSASGGKKPYSWSIYSGSLPAWATLDKKMGYISGKKPVAGTYTFSVKVTDALGVSYIREITIPIDK
jgi:hypothetical protein